VPPAYPTLRLGAHGDSVVWAKARMRSLGAAPTPGRVFGGPTRQALLALQSGAGLQPTGRLDPPTWSDLLAEIVSSSAPPARRAAP
jgi:peptidoglycan hydrolase-like protein with peptidoglycan-binding domain